MKAIIRKRRPTNSGVDGDYPDASSSKRNRTTDCVKILLDVAKESSDWFPPLKAALGGVNALIKHYEHFEDVKERIEDLIPQLNRLKQNITTSTADGDPEETKRRNGLASTFEKIEELSKKLLAKNGVARFADKGEDSKVVARLIERLREAIVCYQISQQQAIYRQITHLASSFDTLLKLQEKPSSVKYKLESVMARLDRLRGASWQELQHERWAKLFDDLGPIRDEAKALHECIAMEGYVEREVDVLAVSGLAEDLRDVVLEYQNTVELSTLNQCRRAQGAEYRHGSRRGCLKGTREGVLSEIESWTKDFNKSPVFWLNGLAGTGKSTIAQTVSERIFADGLLGASFFCSRDFQDRSDLHFIFPTLAFQLAHKYHKFRSVLVPLLQSDPDVVHESLYSQMRKLIVEPLRSADVSAVIVIDALDECTDDEPQSTILSVMGRLVEETPRVKFFITGRPEPRISSGFRLELLRPLTDIFVLHEVQHSLINNDIRLFLKHELSELARRRRIERWPTDEHVELLCRRAAGLFVYASATVKFLDSKTHPPKQRLDVIVNLPECTVPEGRTRFNPKTTLDSLYSSVLQMAFSEEDPEVYPKVRSTIGAVVLLVNPLPPSGITELIGLDPEQVILFLTLVQSLLTLDEDFDQPVKPFHKSFPDFITDPSRCLDMRFYISPGDVHLELAGNCLRLMNNGLEQNILSLPDYALNSEVEDLQTRIKHRISVAMEYACRSWHNHITRTTGDVAGIISDVRFFLEEKFLAWLEVASVLGAVRGAVAALEQVIHWLKEVSGSGGLLDTARDCFYFVTRFFEVTSVSATHIYHSALELSPLSSIVRRLYHHRRVTPSPKVVIGTPDSWKPSIALPNKFHRAHAWTPCGRLIASLTHDIVEVRDSLTSELLSTLHPTKPTTPLIGPLAYSSDRRSLCGASNATIIIWDIQTGGVAKGIEWDYYPYRLSSLAWSLDGRKIGAVLVGNDGIWTAFTYDVASGKKTLRGTVDSVDEPYLWAHDKSFRVMTTQRGDTFDPFSAVRFNLSETRAINIFEVGPALTQVRSFHVSVERGSRIESFSPISHHVAVWGVGQLLILDDRNSVRLSEKGFSSSHCFSPDGNLFAASSHKRFRVWKYNRDLHPGYTPWREFPVGQGRISEAPLLQFSPTSSSISRQIGGVLQVWRLDDLPATTVADHKKHTIFSLHDVYIVTANRWEDTVAITNFRSQTPSQLIDTATPILGLALTGNILLVVDCETIVAWRLTEEGLVDGVSGKKIAGRGDSIWTIPSRMGIVPPEFSVEGQTGFIGFNGRITHAYHTGTGEGVKHIPKHRLLHSRWYNLEDTSRGRYHLHCNRGGRKSFSSDKDISGGWVGDREVKHRLWIPVEWSTAGRATWFHYTATVQIELPEGLIIIQF